MEEDDFDSQWTSQSYAESDYIPDTSPAPAKTYTKSVGAMIEKNNSKGRRRGHIKLYAKRQNWGPGVKIQACFGDNVLTKFTIADKGIQSRLAISVSRGPQRRRASANVTNGSRPHRASSSKADIYIFEPGLSVKVILLHCASWAYVSIVLVIR